MKKAFIFATALALTFSLGLNTVNAQTSSKTEVSPNKQVKPCTKTACPVTLGQKMSDIKPGQPAPQNKISKEEMKIKMDAKIKEFNEALALSPEQIQKVNDAKIAGKAKLKPVMTEIRAKHEQIRDIMNNTELSTKAQDKKITSVKKDLIALEQKARQIRLENEKAFLSVLNPEQKIKYEQMKQDFKENRQNAFKSGHKGGFEKHTKKQHLEDYKASEHNKDKDLKTLPVKK